jgi:modulator of FtsH protease HflK
VVFLEPGEQGLIERFGKPVENRAVLEPGPHLKWPWPIDRVHRFPTREVQSFSIGFEGAEAEKEETVLWTVSHYKEEFNLLVASREQGASTNTANADAAVPVNLLSASIPVQYQIHDVRAWAYKHSDPGQLLEKVATREVVRYLVAIDLEEIMSTGRLDAARILRERIQARADELNLGVTILFVGLQDIHPPVAVAGAYQDVIGARQEIEAKILSAEGYRAKTVPLAEAEALRRIREAEAYQMQRVADALARAAQFTNQIKAFTASPRVYPQRVQMQTIARALAGSRKVLVVSTNTQDVYQLNLEDKLRPDLLDISVPAPKRQ